MKIPPLVLLAWLVPGAAFAQLTPTYSDADAANHIGEEATVVGKVAAVSTSGKGTTFLNFGDRFPRQTFSGVIFSRDEAGIGDVKGWEGKEVALTGKIEASPEGKPQIVIKQAGQITAAAPVAPPAPAPGRVPATPPTGASSATPAMASPPSAPASAEPGFPSPEAKMVLASNWMRADPRGEMTRKDLAKLFGAAGSPSESVAGDPAVEVYPGIPFLAPLVAAKKALNLEGASAWSTKLVTPGLPQDSLTGHGFSGVFLGGFDRLYLITDNADQVVSVLLVEENTRARVPNQTDSSGYHTYNFVTGRVKSTNELTIRHALAPDGPPGVVVVESMLVDPTDPENRPPIRVGRSASYRTTSSSKPKTGKVLERSRWYVPAPIVNVILRCAAR